MNTNSQDSIKQKNSYKPPKCPKCCFGSHVMETRRRRDGTIRRRLQCQNSHCDYKWTVCTGEYLKPKPLDERLSMNDFRDILTSSLSQPALAKKYDCSVHSIHSIQYGKTMADILPEIKRKSVKQISVKRSCHNCLGWVREACKIGWPDPSEIGPLKAARYCPDYAFNKNAVKPLKMTIPSLSDSEIDELFSKWWSENYPNVPGKHARMTHVPFAKEVIAKLSETVGQEVKSEG